MTTLSEERMAEIKTRIDRKFESRDAALHLHDCREHEVDEVCQHPSHEAAREAWMDFERHCMGDLQALLASHDALTRRVEELREALELAEVDLTAGDEKALEAAGMAYLEWLYPGDRDFGSSPKFLAAIGAAIQAYEAARAKSLPEDVQSVVERLRATTEEMASHASVAMGLWDRHSHAALEAATLIDTLAGRVAAQGGE